MDDAVSPSNDEFRQVLEESFKTWYSYLDTQSENTPLPRHTIELTPLVGQTPPFLGDGLASAEKSISFACEEKKCPRSKSGFLYVNGQSTWRTSQGICDLEPKVIPKRLLLADSEKSNMRLSEDSPFSDWPGIQGLTDYDNGNYLAVLYLAWAYILSARWVELLSRSGDHECHMAYTISSVETPFLQSDKQSVVDIEIDNDACDEERFWWHIILCSDDGWDATAEFNGNVYFSPWSVSAKNLGLTLAKNGFRSTDLSPPGSSTALEYLSRFCVHRRLYAQCSVALAAVLFIPSLRHKTALLPYPKKVPRLERKDSSIDPLTSIPDLLNDHRGLLPRYMTLSSSRSGMSSLLASTFFNANIECNLASAWLNPAFAVLHSILSKKILVAAFLANRQPRLGILWLGATLMNLAYPMWRDVRTGLSSMDLEASAWTGITQTFMTSKVGTYPGELIHRDDECRLLFITASEDAASVGQDQPPVWNWKPFGSTRLCDTELLVRQHAQCIGHCFEYEHWEWILTNGSLIRESRTEISQTALRTSSLSTNKTLAEFDDHEYDMYSQELSQRFTSGIFRWLRSTGFTRNERPLYQHPWLAFDLEADDDEEEVSNCMDSDTEIQLERKAIRVGSWLESVE
ncbi:hypothetical protein N7466_008094 [Penicillium verhagenii]|uniref:uncharacterized protein n=1 Tax=Penicillium verhagenii TaxID=1562060 RepID=UPI0025451B8B|nr:uncharacterized protein N7466_008094 [Penicillium verhagenii]KAJ5923907.1 hypothetical protein N7466_008094 [Penicillium verhagenii]